MNRTARRRTKDRLPADSQAESESKRVSEM